MTHRAIAAGGEVLICIGQYANHIGVLTSQKPIQDSRNWVVSVADTYVEYAPSALRIWPNGRREDGVIRPEDYEARNHSARDDRIAMSVQLRLQLGVNKQEYIVTLLECDKTMSDWYLIAYPDASGHRSYIRSHQVIGVIVSDNQ